MHKNINNMTARIAKYVLELVPLPACIQVDSLKEVVKNYLAPRMDIIRRFRKSPNLAIEDDFSEWWMTDATQGKWIGGGSCPMDLISKSKEGFDAMCVCINGAQSNEKSIIQNFSTSGDALDTYFKENKHQEALDLFRKDLEVKWANVETEKELSAMYYACFISNTKSVYLAVFQIHKNNLKMIESDGFCGTGEVNKSIKVKGFIDPEHGRVTLYKSKKRMELRLTRDLLKHANVIELFSLPTSPPVV